MTKRFYIHKEEIQIVFKSDPDLKGKALEKAKQEGVTLKAVLCMAMRAYVNDELVMGMWQKIEHYESVDIKKEESSPPAKPQAKKKQLKEKKATKTRIKSDIKNYQVGQKRKREV